MADMKEKLHQAVEELKQAKTKIEPYFDKAKPFLRKAKELSLEGMKAAVTKACQLKDNYFQKKAAEKENLSETNNPVIHLTSKKTNDSQQPPSNP